nr:hypothetical protein [uncultured Sphingomonas sp.]
MTTTTTKPDPLFKSVSDFGNFSAGMMVLGELAPERLTMSQAIFFVLAASADLAGRDPTYTDVKEAVGDKINKSLATTYKIFLPPSRVYPNGLGWLVQEVNPNDTRVKFLRLSKKGRMVMREVLAGMKGE